MAIRFSFFRFNAFSLLECLIVLLLISLICLFAIPSFQNIFEEQRATLWCTKLSQAWAVAKMESMILGKRLWLCSRVINNKCEMIWREGIGIYPESAGNLATKSLYKITALPQHCRVQWQGFLKNSLIIVPPNLSHAALSGRFNIECGKIHYALISNRIGNLRVEKMTNSPYAQ